MKRKKVTRSTLKRWTPSELNTLQRLAGKKTLQQISSQLNRTAKAVEQKASTQGISLRLKAA